MICLSAISPHIMQNDEEVVASSPFLNPTTCIESGESMGKAIPLTVNVQGVSKTFSSITKAGIKFGVSRRVIEDRLKKGWTTEQAVGLEDGPKKNWLPVVVKHQGISHTFKSLRECGRAFGFSTTSITERIKKGWTIEEAVGLVLKTGECCVCGERFIHPLKYTKPDKKFCSAKCSDTTRDRKHVNAMQRKRRKSNLEKYRKKEMEWYYANQEKVRAINKRTYHKNKHKFDHAKRAAWEADQMKNNPIYALKKRLRDRLRKAIKNNYKAGSAVRDLGCSVEYFKEYIESKFTEGMSWNNWCVGGWVLDHIIPLNAFDLTDREQLLKAVHYTNMQPLWEDDNLRKAARY